MNWALINNEMATNLRFQPYNWLGRNSIEFNRNVISMLSDLPRNLKGDKNGLGNG